MDPYNFAVNLAREAGDQLRDRYWNKNLDSHIKDDKSLVTVADKTIDALISQSIKTNFPEDGILSEESIQSLDADCSSIWVIDPLDGTANFSNGMPVWGVSIARLTSGKPTLGVLYFPLTDDIYAAQRGRGAYRNNQPLKPLDTIPMPFFSCCSQTHRTYRIEVPYKTRISGSVAFNLASVARGGAAISLEIRPKIWDVAAAWVIVEEAGALIEIFAGESPFPVRKGIDYNKFQFSTLAAINQQELEKAKRWIKLPS